MKNKGCISRLSARIFKQNSICEPYFKHKENCRDIHSFDLIRVEYENVLDIKIYPDFVGMSCRKLIVL